MPGFAIPVDAKNCDEAGVTPRGPNYVTDTVRRHRYELRLLNPVKDVLLYAYKCQRPTAEFDKITIHHGQEEISKPGKVRWPAIEVSFYEPIAYSGAGQSVTSQYNRTAKLLYAWYAQAMYNPDTALLRPDSSYKQQCKLALLDGRGAVVWAYRLYDVWPSKITPSELAYTDTELSDITVTLEINKAVEAQTEDS